MGRTVAVIWHASVSVVAVGLYFNFVLPRWPELTGQTSPTLGLALRIVTGVLVALAALPVVFTLLRTRQPEYATPQLALRLRSVSVTLHVLPGLLIVGTAISEVWLPLDRAGQWLFGSYGAAAAIALLGMFGFYLAFVAELPPPAPKPLKTREKVRRRGRKDAQDTEDATVEEPESTAQEAEAIADAQPDDASDKPDDSADDAQNAPENTEATRGRLRNRRPANKSANSRLRRPSRSGVAVDD